jgi:hypothetical protein
MTHETRVFVVGQGVAGAAACIERHTPLVNAHDRQFPDLFEMERNGGREWIDPEASRLLQAFAEIVVAQIAAEAPDLRSYVLDLALDAERRPLMIELNPIGDAGLYGAPAHRLFAAVEREARWLAPAPQALPMP